MAASAVTGPSSTTTTSYDSGADPACWSCGGGAAASGRSRCSAARPIEVEVTHDLADVQFHPATST
ncbi:hypothetical protein ACFQX7_14150 [Luedemannella flava]